ncbi:phosphate ABC transporter ATP-binding protein, PhoT family [Desulfosporosinus acidiphilus SJ4]|uniref:Phosphate ABC transporter ATP-binding protein, PhoT family n=1 Tax=Desulfosporosinus acidiphilus (strain DSM 22704 / JCM 16185 / SJ4) TaxID=646529 RepID=I4D8J7_DESAJ|nr:phosphate ABC transporter ATP-binding protein PstB [Desulfosporosinus acidiphilus]AFM42121.1 phosphate ABC transporter ATP-binding protein, PhoT family [Desulfosporosinus acidiphilus SJ4]
MGQSLSVRQLEAWYGTNQTLKGINMEIAANQVTAIIGPSGCGKSTFVRCINRMHDTLPGSRVKGDIILDGESIYAQDPVSLRKTVGMVFQKPNPFPSMSIFENVVAGVKLNGMRNKQNLQAIAEKSLRMAALWDEVKDRLNYSGMSLSGGQQQRLCIARALAVEPSVLLMDEPASALDPIATMRIEELVVQLKSEYTIVIVTHNMQQAARIADTTAFFLNGELIEHGPTSDIFTNPRDKRTEDYITGRFG